MSKMISAIVPTYNEKDNVRPLVNELEPVLKKISKEYEIIFVDDSSPDGTGDVVKEVSKKNKCVRLVTRKKKQGIGAAHLSGFDSAKGDIIVTLDVDLSQHPRYILEFMKKLDNGYDMVIGSRYVKGGAMKGKGIINDIGSRFTNLMSFLILGLRIKDASHTFRAFKKSIYLPLKGKIKSKGHPAFEVEFTYKASKNKAKICEIPMIFIEREGPGESKISLHKEFINYIVCLFKIKKDELFGD